MDKQSLKFLAWGYKTAIFLSIFGLIASSAYLFYFLYKSHPDLIKLDTMVGFSAERRMVLLSTAIFVAMSFGFLGFGLFLIQAKGEIEGSLDYKNVKVNIARMSPGIFVILCATVIIICCATFRIAYKQTILPGSVPAQQTGYSDSSEYLIEETLPQSDYNPTADSTRKTDTAIHNRSR